MHHISTNFKVLISSPWAKRNIQSNIEDKKELNIDEVWITHDFSEDFVFNDCFSIFYYYCKLQEEFEIYAQTIKKSLNKLPNKFERLLFIKTEKKEFEKVACLMNKDEISGKYWHSNFKFNDTLIKATDSIFEKFEPLFSTMEDFITKTINFFQNISETIETLSDSDFSLKSEAKPSDNGSSLIIPVKSFELFFLDEAFIKFKLKFCPELPKDCGYNVGNYLSFDYDEDTETITIEDYDITGTPQINQYTFKDHLEYFLQEESSISKSLIDSFILNCEPGKVSNYLQIVITKLTNISKSITASKLINKYVEIINPIISDLANYINNNYSSFINKQLITEQDNKPKIIDDKIEETQLNLEHISSDIHKIVKSFRWKDDGLPKTIVLHHELIQKKFISDDTNIEIFKQAFDGRYLSYSLDIKWIKKGRNMQVTKSALFSLIEALSEKGLIDNIQEIKKTKLYKRIEMIFVDEKGIGLKNLPTSHIQSMNGMPDCFPEITEIITSLKSVSKDKKS